MKQNCIVADTGSLISLEKLPNGYVFLRKLYEKIIIPFAVSEEISQKHSNIQEYLKTNDIEDFIDVQRIEPTHLQKLERLDYGETEAIKLALQLDLELLIEERKGKIIAKELGIKPSGVAGQIFKAFKSEILEKPESLNMLHSLLNAKRLNVNTYNALKSEIEK